MKCTTITILLIFITGVLLLISGTTSKREGYGGPIKSGILRIPKTECNTICENHFYDCLDKTRLLNYNLCESNLQACKLVCKYSNFQRL